MNGTTTSQTRAAQHLSAIIDMWPDLTTQAQHRSNDRQIPGGDALVLASPGGNKAYMAYQYMSALMGRTTPVDDTHESDADPDPVIRVLAYWDDELRTERGEMTDLPATVKRCADYIRQTLDWAYSDQAGEFDADGMLQDLGRLRSRMEAVLRQGYRPDRTQVPCLEDDCDATLNKEWHTQVKYDGYRCPQCRRFYDRDAFMRARADQLNSVGAEKWVRRQDAIDAISNDDRSPKTVQKWITDGKVEIEVRNGQQWVWWPHIRQLHLETPTRARKKGE